MTLSFTREGKSESQHSPECFEETHVIFHSLLRRIEHVRTFIHPPKTFDTLAIRNHLKQRHPVLYHRLEALQAKQSVMPRIVDHWTSVGNFRSIVSSNALYGAKALSRLKIRYHNSALSEIDGGNLDNNVICFAPRLVDPYAFVDKTSTVLENPDHAQLLLRLDISKLQKKGKHNQFFKITDLAGPDFYQSISVSEHFSIRIIRDYFQYDHTAPGAGKPIATANALRVEFVYKDQKESATFKAHECLFYGDIGEINYFCLTLLFQSIDKLKNKSLSHQILEEIVAYKNSDLQQLIHTFTKGMTRFSEYNIRGVAHLTPRMIHSIHHCKKGETYLLNEMDGADYTQALDAIARHTPSPSIPRSKTEHSIVGEYCDNPEPDVRLRIDPSLYNQRYEQEGSLYGKSFYYSPRTHDSLFLFDDIHLQLTPAQSSKAITLAAVVSSSSTVEPGSGRSLTPPGSKGASPILSQYTIEKLKEPLFEGMPTEEELKAPSYSSLKAKKTRK